MGIFRLNIQLFLMENKYTSMAKQPSFHLMQRQNGLVANSGFNGATMQCNMALVKMASQNSKRVEPTMMQKAGKTKGKVQNVSLLDSEMGKWSVDGVVW